jgi:hypothetical protein
VEALGSLVPHLAPEQKSKALAEALAAGDGEHCAEALGSLAPYLAEALAAATAIGDEWQRARALRSLARHLAPEQMAEALAAATTMAMTGVAPRR